MQGSKKKDVLIATNHLHEIGGSELYTFYLIKALKKNFDFQLEYFTLHKGVVSERIEEELQIPFKSKEKYDLIFAGHATTVNYLFGLGPIVQICHGIIPILEQPSPLADYHIGVSEEVVGYLKDKGFPATLIHNGIDLSVYKPLNPIHGSPQKILSLSQSETANGLIADICKEKKIAFQYFNKFKNPKFCIAEEINEADLVIGLGRSVYDAMACGRPCIIFDDRDYLGNMGDGYLFPEKFQDFVKFNCSGRFSRRQFSKADLSREIDAYRKEDSEELIKIAKAHLNVEEIAKKLVVEGEKISKGDHILFYLKTITSKPFRLIIKEQKQIFRAKLKRLYDSGHSIDQLKEMISKEPFFFTVKISLNFWIIKLRMKRKVSRKG